MLATHVFDKTSDAHVYPQSTYEYSSTLWGQELSTELAKLSSNPSVEGAAGGSINAAATQEVAFLLRAALQSLWTSIATHDVFGSG